MAENLEALWAQSKPTAAPLPAASADLEKLWEKAKPVAPRRKGPEVSGLESIAAGLGQGALGIGDELGAAMQASDPSAVQPGQPLSQEMAERLKLYRQARFENRQTADAAAEQHPYAYYPAMLASALATAPIVPGRALAQGATWGPRLATTALNAFGQAGAYGAGASEADLTRGQFGRFAKDVLKSGTIGALTSGVLGGVGTGLRALRGRAAQGIEDALAQEAAAQQRLTEKAIASQQGTYRSAIQSASRDLEVARREAEEATGEAAEKARAWLEQPETKALGEQVLLSKLETGPQRLSEMAAAKAKLGEMVAGKEAAIEAQTAEALRDPVRKHIFPRLLTLGHRLLPPVLAAAGGAIGGTEGAIGAGVVGTLMSLSQGLPGRIIKNLAEKPAVRRALWERVLTASGGATPGNGAIINALETAAQKGPAAFAAVFHEMTGRSLDEEDEGAEAPPDRAKVLRNALEQQ